MIVAARQHESCERISDTEGSAISGLHRRSKPRNEYRVYSTIWNARRIWFALLLLFTAGRVEAMIVNGGFENGVLSPWFQNRDLEGGAQVDWDVTMALARTGNWSATATGNLELRQNFSGIGTGRGVSG